MPTVDVESDTAMITAVCRSLTGLDVEGLYRVSGKSNDILRIKKQFDNGKIINTLFCHGLIVRVCTMEQFVCRKDYGRLGTRLDHHFGWERGKSLFQTNQFFMYTSRSV